MQQRVKKHGCQERPRHCKPEWILRDVRMVVGEMTFGLARLAEAERETVTAYAARASWPAVFAIYQRGAVADGVFVVTRGRIVLRIRGRGVVRQIGRGHV